MITMSTQIPKTIEELYQIVLAVQQSVIKTEQQSKNLKVKQESMDKRLHLVEVGSPPKISNQNPTALVDAVESEPTKVIVSVPRRAVIGWVKSGKEAYAWFQSREFTNSYALFGAMRYILDKEEGYLEKGSGSKRKRSFADFQRMALHRTTLDDFRRKAAIVTLGVSEVTAIQGIILEMENAELTDHRRQFAIQGLSDTEIEKRLSLMRRALRKKDEDDSTEKTEEEAENDGFSLPANAFCGFLLEQTYHRSESELKKFLEDKRDIHARLLRTEIPKIKRGPTSNIARNLTVSWLEKSFELWKQGK